MYTDIGEVTRKNAVRFKLMINEMVRYVLHVCIARDSLV